MTATALQNVVLQLTETAEKLAALERLDTELGIGIRQQAGQAAQLQALEDAFAALAVSVARASSRTWSRAVRSACWRMSAPRPVTRRSRAASLPAVSVS